MTIEQSAASLLVRWRDWLGEKLTPTRLTAGAATLCLMALIGFWLARTPQVSASELLERSARDETARLAQVAEPVVYRKLQIKRRAAGSEDSIAWESWHSNKGQQFRQRVADKGGLHFIHTGERAAPAIIAELEQIFRVNHWDLQRALSAAGP